MITIEKNLFGKYKGRDIYKYSLKNSNFFQVNILNYGGTITEILVKDKREETVNVVLGYEDFEKYPLNSAYPGMIIGRTAGRIERASFSLEEEEYHLYKNNGKNSLHGGKSGLNDKIYDVNELENGIELFYESPHLEEGYPAKVLFKIRYLISEKNELIIEYEGISDRKTYINLTNHSYFNLSGDKSVNGDEQILMVKADKICELKEGLIPTGNMIDVGKTVFDLREGIKIKDGIERGQREKNYQFEITRAYDCPFELNWNSIEKEPQITLLSNYSGIKLEVFTMERVAVIYTGNFLDEVLKFDNIKNGNLENSRYLGVAIETQDFPNGINEKNFNCRMVDENNKYFTRSIFKFSNNL